MNALHVSAVRVGKGFHQKKCSGRGFRDDNMRSRALAFLLAILMPVVSGANDNAEKFRALVDDTVRPIMAQHAIPGIAVALTVDGSSYVFNYGVSSKESQAPVTNTTVFEIGSISKMFTTTLAAFAHETGKLSLDEHPGRYIAPLRGRPIDKATLLNLGTYTAGGLPLQFPEKVTGDAAALTYLQNWKADAAPGTVRQYSNPSIGLLGAVTAVAMKDDFARLLETRLLQKLGMHHTYIDVPSEAMPNYAWGYREGKPVRVSRGAMDKQAYGIKSTACDMIRFVEANVDPSLLEAPLRRAVSATHAGYFKVGNMVQGFGWEQFAYPLLLDTLLSGNTAEIIFDPNPVKRVNPQAATTPRLFQKTGSTGGFGAYVAFVPARRIGVVILANKSFPIAARIQAAHAILDQLTPSSRADTAASPGPEQSRCADGMRVAKIK